MGGFDLVIPSVPFKLSSHPSFFQKLIQDSLLYHSHFASMFLRLVGGFHPERLVGGSSFVFDQSYSGSHWDYGYLQTRNKVSSRPKLETPTVFYDREKKIWREYANKMLKVDNGFRHFGIDWGGLIYELVINIDGIY